MRRSRNHLRVGLGVLAGIGFALVAGFGAVAYWQAAGSGSATGSTATMSVTVAAVTGGDAPASSLVPGGPPAEVILRVQNPNAFPVQLVAVSANGPVVGDAAHPACTTPDVSFSAPVGLSTTLASGETLVRLTDAATMGTGSSSGCQGARFSIPVTATVKR